MALAFVALVAAQLGGCAGPASHKVSVQSVAEAPAYRLQIGDALAISFLNVPEMDTVTAVLPQGQVSLYHAGDVHIGGKTVEEARAAIVAAYSDYLQDPQITVKLVGLGSKGVTLGGEVKKAGVIPSSGSLLLSQAVIAAGGLKNSADGAHLTVLHQGDDGRPTLSTVNYHRLLRGQSGAQDMRLMPGDVVFVPISRMGAIDRQFALFYSRISPYMVINYQGLGSRNRNAAVANAQRGAPAAPVAATVP